MARRLEVPAKGAEEDELQITPNCTMVAPTSTRAWTTSSATQCQFKRGINPFPLVTQSGR
jgi:hypothetical protein